VPFTPKQQNWKWFANDAAEPSTTLAAENAVPTVATNTAIIRLRLTIAETGAVSGSGAVTLDYSIDGGSTWTTLGSSALWNYANGLATAGGTTTTFKTTDGITHGLYHESGTLSETWAASAVRELDVAIVPVGATLPLGTYQFRAKIGGTAVPLNTGKSYPSLTLSVPAGVGISKTSLYDVLSVPAGVNVSKSNMYDVLSIPEGVDISKASVYTVLSIENAIKVSKANAYAVVEYEGVELSKANLYAVLRNQEIEHEGVGISKALAYAVVIQGAPPAPAGGLFFCHG
jgi:hypothetical protein